MLAGFSVYVTSTSDLKSGTLCYQHAVDELLNNTVNIKCVSSGRYVTIYNSWNQTDTPLSTSTNYSLLLKS